MFKNKKFGLLFIVLLLIVPMVLVACGDDDKDDDGGNGGSDLNQTIEGSGLTVKYPDGWAARVGEDGSILIANKEEILDRVGAEGEGPKAGEFGTIVMAQSLGDMEGMSAREVFDMMVSFMGAEGAGEAEVSEIKVGDKDAWRADVTPEDGTDGFIVGFEADGAMVLVIAVSAEGEIGNFESSALDIAGSVTYSAPAAE